MSWLRKGSKRRALVKAITFRVGSVLLIFGFSFLFTMNLSASVAIAGSTAIYNTAWYFFHESLWEGSK